MRYIPLSETVLACLLCLPAAGHAQESGTAPATLEQDNNSLQQAAKYIDRLVMRRESDGRVIECIDRPLLSFGDSARDNFGGTVWAWGKKGRPYALLELYRGSGPQSAWANAVTLTSAELVTLTTTLPTSWKPARAQFVSQLIDDAPRPAGRETARLRQMKDIARQFKAHEFWDPNNSRFELRLLVQPVLRYTDETAGVLDGGVFVLAHGTNPEIVLLLEASGKTGEAPRWHFSAMPLGSAELHLEREGKEVWKQQRAPGVVGKPDDPYWLFMTEP